MMPDGAELERRKRLVTAALKVMTNAESLGRTFAELSRQPSACLVDLQAVFELTTVEEQAALAEMLGAKLGALDAVVGRLQALADLSRKPATGLVQ